MSDDRHIPEVNVPLDQFIEQIVDRCMAKYAEQHAEKCPVRPIVGKLDERVRVVELRLASLIAFMAGSGALGGVAGAVAARLITG